jgi:hypothetical protein
MLNCCLNDLNNGCCTEDFTVKKYVPVGPASHVHSKSNLLFSDPSNHNFETGKISITLLRRIKKHGSEARKNRNGKICRSSNLSKKLKLPSTTKVHFIHETLLESYDDLPTAER